MRLVRIKRAIGYLQTRLDSLSRWLNCFDKALGGPQAQQDLIHVELNFPIEFIIEAVPLSLQASARSLTLWKQQVSEAARVAIPGGSWATERPVSLTIYYFPDGRMTGDVDNIVKPIMDALAPAIYLNDSQVDRVLVRKFESDRFFNFSSPSPRLAAALETERPIIYIRVDDETSSGSAV